MNYFTGWLVLGLISYSIATIMHWYEGSDITLNSVLNKILWILAGPSLLIILSLLFLCDNINVNMVFIKGRKQK